MRRGILSAFCLIALAACSTVPLTSIPKLMRIDGRTTDLSVLRVAVQLPLMIRPKLGGVILDVLVQTEGQPAQKAAFPLVEVNDETELKTLPAAPEKSHVFAFRLAPADIAQFEIFRKSAAETAATGKKTELFLSVATRHFCLTGEGPQHPMQATIYLKTSETKTYVAFVRDVDLLADKEIAAEMAKVKPCSVSPASG